jgi:hypothetical protein
MLVGELDGLTVDGVNDGRKLGALDGAIVGIKLLGLFVGTVELVVVGINDGMKLEGLFVGELLEGSAVGIELDGWIVGAEEDKIDGAPDGE